MLPLCKFSVLNVPFNLAYVQSYVGTYLTADYLLSQTLFYTTVCSDQALFPTARSQKQEDKLNVHYVIRQ